MSDAAKELFEARWLAILDGIKEEIRVLNEDVLDGDPWELYAEKQAFAKMHKDASAAYEANTDPLMWKLSYEKPKPEQSILSLYSTPIRVMSATWASAVANMASVSAALNATAAKAPPATELPANAKRKFSHPRAKRWEK